MSKSGNNKAILRLSASIFIVGLSPLLAWRAAVAQTDNGAHPNASNVGSLSEVVVTARKRAENVQRVPVAISAVTGAQLKQQSITTLSNLQSLAPGLFIQQGLDDPQSIIVTMRGRKQDDATMAVDASVSLSVDGINIPRTIGMGGSMLDIKRVEVLRGPQGTLYGRNSTGGAIGIYTNDPSDKLSGSIDLTGGDYNTWNAVGIVNLPITDNLAARFVVQRGGNGGYEHNSSGTSLGAEGSDYYRAKLKWTGGHNWQAVLSGHYENDRSEGFRKIIPGLDPADFQGNGLPVGGYVTQELELESNLLRGGLLPNGLPATDANAVALEQSWIAQKRPWYTLDEIHSPAFTSNIERWDVGLTISGDLSDDIQFRSITGIQHLLRKTDGGSQGPIFIFTEHPRSTGTYYSQEFQLLGKTSTFNWVVGAYGGYETGTDSQTIFFFPQVFGAGGTENDSSILNTTVAAYAQATWEFVPDWHLTAGARYTADTRQIGANAFNVDLNDPTVHDCVVPAPGLGSAVDSTGTLIPGASQCPRTFRAAFAQPTWLVSLDHQLTSNVLLYAKVATGYRSGGLNADSGAGQVETFGAFAPETNLEYELGFKSSFFERRVRLNADMYWDDYSNLQVQTTSLTPDGVLTFETNAAKARIRGVEVEGDLIVGGGLSLHASTAYTDAQYLRYVDVEGDHTNDPFSVPKWTYTLNANYTHPTSVGDASLEVDYAWKSAVNLVPTSLLVDAVTQPGYGLLNARVTVHLDAWNMDAALFGQNLTNKYYFDQGIAGAAPGFDVPEIYVGGPPRTFGVELTKKF